MTPTPEQTAADLVRTFNYLDPALNEDPYSVLRQIRSGCPVGRSDELGGYWLVTSYGGVRRVLTDPVTFSSRTLTLPPEGAPTLVPETIDPPDHARYRRVFTPYFSPRRIETLTERAREVARELIGTFVANGGGDIIEQFAVPLPCTMFMEIAGFPIADLAQMIEWKDAFMRDSTSDDPARRQHVAEFVMPRIMEYFNKMIDDRLEMDNPPDDLVTGLVTGELTSGVTMAREEILSALLLLIAAGLDTVTAATGRSIEYLATHPDVRKRLVDDPSLIPSATEEFLRYFSLVTNCRQANVDAEIEGIKVSVGDYVTVCGPSANRDERQFNNADEIDIERSPNPHLAFGVGPHRCLGSHLARMEMQVAFEELHRVMPDYHITPGTTPKHHFGGVMGIDNLHLTIGLAPTK